MTSLRWIRQESEIGYLKQSIKTAFRTLKYGPPSLDHIKLDQIRVIDTVGRELLVPTMLCLAWEVSIARSSHDAGSP